MKIKFILIINLFVNIFICLTSRINLDSNYKFQDVLIFIKDDVEEGNGDLLINIQNSIIEASKSLWTATSNLHEKKSGVQFGTVYIVIPLHWKTSTYEYITWQQCNKADILITTLSENNNEIDPFTKQIGKCGDPGNFTRIPADFFTNINSYKLKGRKIMGEFVKYRYGVFSEKPFKNVLTVSVGESVYLQSSCGANIKWSLFGQTEECSIINNNCKYNILGNQNHIYSIMFDETTESSEFFCDDNNRPHNKMAFTLHNLKCNQQSISSVILKHSDFKSDSVKVSLTTVNFKVLKSQRRKMVLVLDVSGSMVGINIENMRLAAIYFLNEVVEVNSEIGIAVFSTSGEIKSPLRLINDSATRNELANIIKLLMATSMTNIPDGLRKGIQILGGNMENTDPLYGTIFLLTDGMNNEEEQDWNNNIIINRIVSKGLVVNTIVYGNVVDQKLSLLATASGGRYKNVLPSSSYMDLMRDFAYKSSCESVKYSSIKVLEGNISINTQNVSEILKNFIYVDPFVGQNLTFTLIFNIELNNYNFSVISPIGDEYFQISKVIQSIFTTLIFKINGDVNTGMFKLKLKPPVSSQRAVENPSINFILSATPNRNLSRFINPSGEISQSEIEIVNNKTILTVTVDLSSAGITNDEKVDVWLTMGYPDKSMLKREMFDNGLGCDSSSADKIFTTCIYPRELTQLNFYTFKAYINITQKNLDYPIQRIVDLESMRVKSVSNNIQDTIPPAQINDVKLKVIDRERRILKINNSATGNDGIFGNISQYDIKIKSSNEMILTQYYDSIPLQPISFTINLYNITSIETFRIAIRGVDNNNNSGDWSNEMMFTWAKQESNHSNNHLRFLSSLIVICLLIYPIFK